MTETVRLSLVEQKPRRLFSFGRKSNEPDFVLFEQMKLRAADTCLEHIRSTFQILDDQMDVWELMGKMLKNAEVQQRALRHRESGE